LKRTVQDRNLGLHRKQPDRNVVRFDDKHYGRIQQYKNSECERPIKSMHVLHNPSLGHVSNSFLLKRVTAITMAIYMPSEFELGQKSDKSLKLQKGYDLLLDCFLFRRIDSAEEIAPKYRHVPKDRRCDWRKMRASSHKIPQPDIAIKTRIT
jgi:hypothetical protein